MIIKVVKLFLTRFLKFITLNVVGGNSSLNVLCVYVVLIIVSCVDLEAGKGEVNHWL